MQEGTPVPPWGYRCVPGLNRHNHVYLQNSNMIVFMKLSTKHLHKNLYKTKQKNLKKNFFFFQKISSIHKRLCRSMHANIKSSDESASHHSQRQKFIHVLQEHYTRRKEQHSIITKFQTVSVHCFEYILWVVQSNTFKTYLTTQA